VDTDAVSPAAPAPAAPAKSAAKAWGWTLYGVGLLVLAVRIAVATLYLDSPSYEMADAGLVLVNFAIIVASAFLVYFDAKRLGVGRLHLAKVKLSSTDRTTPGSWAIVVFLLWIATMPWYLAIRGRLVQRVQLADQVGYFNTPKEAKAARKAHKKLEDGTPFPV
jgi:hypothetical protein